MSDAYWDELGVAWRASVPEPDKLVTQLRARLRRQTLIMWANIVLEIAITVVALMFAGFLIWRGMGNGGTWRHMAIGAAAAVFVVIVGAITIWARRGTSGGTASLAGMIDLSIARAEGALRYAYATLILGPIALVFMAIVWFIRFGTNAKPAHVVQYMAAAFVIAWVVGWSLWAVGYSRRARRDIDKFTYLKRILGNNP